MPNYEKAFNEINRLINDDDWLKNNYPLPKVWNQLDGKSPKGEHAIKYWNALLNKLEINLQSRALEKTTLDIMEILLDNGFNIKSLPCRNGSESLLYTAVFNGHASLVEKLLMKGTNPRRGYTRNMGMMGSYHVSPLDRLLSLSPRSVQSENFKTIGEKLFEHDFKVASMNKLKKAFNRGFVEKEGYENHPVFVFHEAHKKQMEKDIAKDRAGFLGFFPCVTFRKTSITEDMSINKILEHAQRSNNRSRRVMQELGWIDEAGNVKEGSNLQQFLGLHEIQNVEKLGMN